MPSLVVAKIKVRMIQTVNPSTSNISNRIAEIIDKRQGLAKHIQPVYQHLATLTTSYQRQRRLDHP
jgi:hypothetical protein